MPQTRIVGLVLFGLLTLTLPIRAAAQTTALVFDSQPGDYIGGGIDQTFTTADGTFTAMRNYDNGISVHFNGGPHWWYVEFAAPGDSELAVGAYENATRLPFHSPTSPGLSISGEGRGCNTLTGRFEVLEVVYGPGGDVERFAATFEQHCEGQTPALLGSILYNSTLPPPPPGPSHCPATIATIPEMIGQINALPTSAATRNVLGAPLFLANWASLNGYPQFARTMVAGFVARAVAVSNLSAVDPNRVAPAAANRLVCAAGNVLTNIAVP